MHQECEENREQEKEEALTEALGSRLAKSRGRAPHLPAPCGSTARTSNAAACSRPLARLILRSVAGAAFFLEEAGEGGGGVVGVELYPTASVLF